MTKEFYAVVKTAIDNTNWDPSQLEIVDRVKSELESLYRAEPKVVKIEGLDNSVIDNNDVSIPTDEEEESKIPMPGSIADTIRQQVEALQMNKGLKIKDPADAVIEEPIGRVDPDELYMEEANTLYADDIKK